jgi:hypothetical protein
MDAFALQSLAFSQPSISQQTGYLPYFLSDFFGSTTTFGQAPVPIPIPGTNLQLNTGGGPNFNAIMAQALLQPALQLSNIWGSLSGGFQFPQAPQVHYDQCHNSAPSYDYSSSYANSVSYGAPQQTSVAVAATVTPPPAAVSYG